MSRRQQNMATEISVPTFKVSENYELWKQETLAWAVITDLDKEKQAIAVALNLPNDKNIKEKVFSALKLEDLYSVNGMSIMFECLDKYLLDDGPINSFNKFEDFENFERKQNQNIRECVANFELNVGKLEKQNIKLPSEILALKLLRKANLSKQEKMIVLSGINLEDKVNIFKDMKNSLIKFVGELTNGKAETGPQIRLEPAWKKSISSCNSKCYGQYGSNGGMKKKLNPVGSDGQTLLCNYCGSYRHLVAECPDSWENMVKGKSGVVKLRDQSDEQKLKGKIKSGGEELHIFDKHVDAEIAQLKEEIEKLKAEIKEVKALKNKELKGQKEVPLKGKDEMEKVKAVKDTGLKRQKEESLKGKNVLEEEKEHMEDNRNGRTEDQGFQDLGSNRSRMGTMTDQRRHRKKETKSEIIQQHDLKMNGINETKQRFLEKAKKVKQKLQRTHDRDKTISSMSEKLVKQKLNKSIDTDNTFQRRQWFWWPVERQLIN